MRQQVLVTWQLDDLVLFICFVLVTVEARASSRTLSPSTW
jgi:hypothetical protein